MKLSQKMLVLGVPALALAVVLAVVLAVRPWSRPAGAAVGRVEMEDVFHAYTQTADFEDIQRRARDVHEKMDQALAEQDQEKMHEYYETLQDMQLDFGRGFEAAVERAVARVSAEKGLSVVVGEVIYAAPGARVVNVTADVIAAAGLEVPPGEFDLPFGEEYGEGEGEEVHVHGPDCDH